MTLSPMAAKRAKSAAKKAKRLAKALRLQAARQITTEAGEALVIPPRWTLKTLKGKLKAALHAEIRRRDGAVCISCGSNAGNQAGHLFAVGPFPSMQFHPLNISVQDAACNLFKRGNHAAYSAAFVRRYGVETFLALSAAASQPRQWTAGELFELLTILRRDGLAGYTARYYSLTGWNVEGKAA